MTVDPADKKQPLRDPSRQRLDRLVRLAQAAHLWERVWRGLVPALIVVGLFLCVSWLGLWMDLPHIGRLVGVIAFAALFVLSLLGLRHVRPLRRANALARIDKASALGHRPASVLEDTLANGGHDPATAALWTLHRRRAEAVAKDLRAGSPSPRVVDLDRYALRGGVLVALVACAFIAGPERYARTAAAFEWDLNGGGGAAYRLDAWIDPPPYTGKAPVLLDLASDAARNEEVPQRLEAPAGSIVIIRSSGGGVEVETTGPLLPPPAPKDKPQDTSPDKTTKTQDEKAPGLGPQGPLLAGDTEQRFVLHGDSRLVLRHGGTLRGLFDLTAIPDKPPTIMLREIPKANARGSLTLAYTVGDDYGVSSAEAVFAKPAMDGVPAPGPSLVDPPKMALLLPALSGGVGDAETTTDLSEHPWAGARVTMTLVAHDEGGNEGRSDPVEITLPQRPFLNPLARALVEQRRNLVLDSTHPAGVEDALDTLMIDPDAFKTTPSVYLGLRFARTSLAKAAGKADLVAVADFLWTMALQIENGDLSDAERALRDAEAALRAAIDRRAPPEEIKKLTEALQAAMDKFLNELAQQEQRDDQKQADSKSKPGKTISRKDLQALIDKLQQASRSGNKEEAKKALEELQDLLENLKAAKRQKPDPKDRAMAQALNELDQMTRDQQDLRDETFKDQQSGGDQPPPRPGPKAKPGPKSGQRGPSGQDGAGQDGDGQDESDAGQDDSGAPGQPGKPNAGQPKAGAPKPGQPGSKDGLQQRQKALRDRLDAVQKRLKQAGEGQDALDEAGKAMKEAEDALNQGEGSRGEAVDEQGKALDNLRKGTKKLADAMQKGDDDKGGGQADGDKDGEGAKGTQEGQKSGDADPLGRPRGGNPFNARSTFDPMGLPAAQRAQRVLEELRRRLGDPSRPREETDYLERLLGPY